MSTEGPRQPAYLTIGTITSPRGLRGEVNVFPHTDRPERFRVLEAVWLGREGEPSRKVAVESVADGGRLIALKLQGVDCREQAESLRGVDLLVPVSEAWPLPQDTYYHYQLIGLAVYDKDGTHRGELTRVYPGPANDCFAVVPPGGGREQLVPALRSVVLRVDLGAGRMVVDWPREE